jgi:nucleoside-diphosphate-sugar epimerase
MKLVNGGSARRCYTYIDDAVECVNRIVMNPGNVCDRQIFNIGSPSNEVSIRQMAEMMCDIYAEKYRGDRGRLPRLVSVTGDDFYGTGYEDSDRRIPDITKARMLLGWEPVWNFREMLEVTMDYYVTRHRGATTAVMSAGNV